MIKRVRVSFFAAIAILLLPLMAFAGGDDPQSGFRIQPVLQTVTDSQIAVMWETWGADKGKILISTDRNFNLVYKTIDLSNVTKRHKVRISGLTPSTPYYIKVISDNSTSTTGSFVTAPLTGQRTPFRFAVYGDSRKSHWAEDIAAKYGDNDDHLPVCISMHTSYPDFVVHVGDFVLSGNEMDDIYNFFDVEKELLLNHPIVPVYGNHEFSGGSYEDNTLMDGFFIPPNQDGGSFSWYSYDYANVHILVVNTGAGVFANDDFSIIQEGSKQHTFAKKDLEKAAKNPDIDHIFVALHAPPYSVANFGDNQQLIDALEPMMIENGVKAVFMGHEHDYQHMTNNGIHYILSGGAGSGILDYPWKGDDDDSKAKLIKYDDVLNYVIVDVNGENLLFEARKVQGNGNTTSSVIERFSL